MGDRARMMQSKRRVGIIGSGCWGSAVAKMVGQNVLENPDTFHSDVLMYVFEEIVNDRKLTEIINTEHENVKYLPETKIPANVVAVPDVTKAAANADVIIFILPHQFVADTCLKIKPVAKRTALGVSMIKGLIHVEGEGLKLVSKTITEMLGLTVAVVTGANLATECAVGMYVEATIATEKPENDDLLRTLFQTNYFRCSIVRSIPTAELCGAIKNVIAIGAGLVDGLGYSDNTKVACIRIGMAEMMRFNKVYLIAQGLDPVRECDEIYLHSCGIADLVATCHGGRNRLLGEALIKSMKKRGVAGVDVRLLEKEILRGQSFQGPVVAKELYKFITENAMMSEFPLLTCIHLICTREVPPQNFLDALRNHPEHRHDDRLPGLDALDASGGGGGGGAWQRPDEDEAGDVVEPVV